jgi:hypothetical protein
MQLKFSLKNPNFSNSSANFVQKYDIVAQNDGLIHGIVCLSDRRRAGNHSIRRRYRNEFNAVECLQVGNTGLLCNQELAFLYLVLKNIIFW